MLLLEISAISADVYLLDAAQTARIRHKGGGSALDEGKRVFDFGVVSSRASQISFSFIIGAAAARVVVAVFWDGPNLRARREFQVDGDGTPSALLPCGPGRVSNVGSLVGGDARIIPSRSDSRPKAQQAKIR